MEQPLSPATEVGEITVEDLKAYDGSNPNKPILIAMKGQIYDVSQNKKFYGPGEPYAMFGGKEASRALATVSFQEKNFAADISGLSSLELENLQYWENKFMNKYAKVGITKRTKIIADHGFVSSPVNVVSSVVQQEEEEHQIKGCLSVAGDAEESD